MRRLSQVVIALLFCSASVRAQETFQILGLSPATGSLAGGTSVTIRLNALPNCAILDPGPAVSFGGSPASGAVYGPDSTIMVTTPAHTAGAVEVRVDACGAPQPIVASGAFTFVDPSQPFNVLSIAPSAGSTFGGTDVVIQLDDIPFCFDPVPGTAVFFGGVEAKSVTVNEPTKQIIAVTPQYAPGVVDVLVQTCGGPQVVVPNGFTYDVNIDPTDGYEKVLFPIIFSGPGALGSKWDTQISVYNTGDAPVDSAQGIFEGDPRSACPAVCGCGVSNTVEPRSTREVCVDGFQDPAGLIYYPRRRFADQLAFGSRVFDTSRSGENFGTEIPVVRESEFRTDQIALLNVPLHGRQRVALRVYDPDQHRSAQVAMTILDGVTGETIGSATISTEYSIVTILPDPFPLRPGFAYVGDLDKVVSALVPSGAQIDRYHVLLIPLTPGLRFWAFVSVTNNDTQLVTTISPQ